MKKTFTTRVEMYIWIHNTHYDRYSPYNIVDVNWDTLTVMYTSAD